MISRRAVELWVGVFVIAGGAALFMLAMKVSNLSTMSTGDAYRVEVRFANVGSLGVRAPVRASGVLVGRVSDIRYDDSHYEAVVTLSIEKRFNRFPKDTTASILTAGMLGEQYVDLAPGGEDENLKDGDRIMFSDSAMVLEKLIGRMMVDKLSK